MNALCFFFVLRQHQACRCSAVSTDSILGFVAITDEDVPLEESRMAEERQFRGSHVPDLATLAETGGAGADGVCGYVLACWLFVVFVGFQ